MKEIKVTNALDVEIQPDGAGITTVDAYKGCQFQCPYCFQMNDPEWEREIYVRTNIVDVLKNQMVELEKKNEPIFLGSLSDPYMEAEEKYELTRGILNVLKDATFQTMLTTKATNGLILRDLELLQEFRVKPQVMIGLSAIWEAEKGAKHSAIQIANRLYHAGIDVQVFITPVLPYIMDVEAMVEAIEPAIPIFIDKLRVFTQGNQAQKVYHWIQRKYPQYEQEYASILFEKDETYYGDLVKRYSDNKRIHFLGVHWNAE